MPSSRTRLVTRAAAAGAVGTAMVAALLSAPVSAEAATPTQPTAGAPVTVPALQQWEPGGEDFTLGPGAIRLQVDPRFADDISDDADSFSSDLHAITHRRVLLPP